MFETERCDQSLAVAVIGFHTCDDPADGARLALDLPPERKHQSRHAVTRLTARLDPAFTEIGHVQNTRQGEGGIDRRVGVPERPRAAERDLAQNDTVPADRVRDPTLHQPLVPVSAGGWCLHDHAILRER